MAFMKSLTLTTSPKGEQGSGRQPAGAVDRPLQDGIVSSAGKADIFNLAKNARTLGTQD